MRITNFEPEPELRRLVDLMIPREVATKALMTYDRFLLGTEDPVYSLQRAFLLAAEEMGWHRHLRAGPQK